MKLDMKYFRGIILPFLFGLAISCDAPRLNPLDPQNPDYHLAAIDGFVKKTAGTQQPISGVKVFWKNQSIVVETDASGYFKIDQILPQNGTIVFEKDGYSKDSVSISFENQKTQNLGTLFLNEIPQLKNLIFYTSVQNRYPDVQSFELFVKAQITDAENDVDSVFVRCTELNINKRLVLNSTTQFYENKFSPGDLNLKSMDEGIGKNFSIIVKDRSKKTFNIDSATIKRIIKQDISFLSPANSETVSNRPKFIWKRFLPGFNFTYMFEIYTNETSPLLVIQKQNISKDEIEFTPSEDLPPGEYFWVIWCIDDFQNRSRSLPASFVVQ